MLKPKVYIASPVGKRKSYTSKVLPQVAFCEEIRLFEDTAPDDMEIVPRIAKVREEIRKAFLKSDCTHLYFHDADMIPPYDIVERLLTHDRDIASGLYVMRKFTEPIVPVMGLGLRVTECSDIREQGLFTNDNVQEVISVGMGCMLIRREVLEKVCFRATSYYTHNKTSEDYQFCVDAFEAGFKKPVLDLSLPCWHVDSDGLANLPIVSNVQYTAIYKGCNGQVRNRYGVFIYDTPTPISEENAANLNYEFTHGYTRTVAVLREKKI